MWTDRPCKLVLEGDLEGAVRYKNYARQKILALRANGAVDYTQHTFTPPGATVKVMLGGPFDVVQISSSAGIESGLYKMAPPRFNDMMIDPTWPIKQANGSEKLAVKDFYPRKEVEKVSTYGGWQPNYVIAKNYTKADEKSDSIIGKTPGRFAGTMRKVVQLLIGLGKPVPYNYQWHQCHGIYTASDGRPWVIEISPQGVKAWKLPRTKLNPATTGTTGIMGEIASDLGYVPQYVKMDKQSKNAKVLLGAGSVSPFYTKAPMFTGCGWAFSYDGSVALNTCWGMTSDGYKQSYLYQITISESEGEPAAATLSMVRSGLVYGNRVSGFKVPEEALGMCVDFDLYYGKSPYRLDSDGPLYAFFRPDGSTVTVSMSPGVASVHDVSWFVWGGSGTISMDSFQNKNMNHWTDNAPVVSGGYPNAESYSGAWEDVDIHASNRNGYFTSETGETGGQSLIKNEFREGTLHSEYWQTGSNRVFNLSAIVPYYDREAIYSIKRVTDYGNLMTRDVGHTTFVRGTAVAVLNYTITGQCGGGSGWVWNEGFSHDPRIGTYYSTWQPAGFSRELPFLPSGEGQAVCAARLPSLGDSGATTTSGPTYTEKVKIDVQLIASSGQSEIYHKEFDSVAAAMADDTDKFFDFWDGGNLRWMAVYADAFNTGWAYAYKAPNLHDDLYASVAHYPSVNGQLMPICFVGKP